MRAARRGFSPAEALPDDVRGMLTRRLTELAGLMLLALAIVMTTILAYLLKATMGLRPSEEVEEAGLDVAEHGEEGYHEGGEEGFGHATAKRAHGSAMTGALADPAA